MTDRPILFSASMIRSLIDGRKTQTRRIIKAGGQLPEFCGGGPRNGIDWHDPCCWGWLDYERDDWITVERDPASRISWRDWRGAWQLGDRLWVREAHAFVPVSAYRNSLFVEQHEDPGDVDRAAIFREGFDRSTGGIRWRPSIHMPRWASRLTLLVTDVRVQQLQDISEADAKAEGLKWVSPTYGVKGLADSWSGDPRHAFRTLWNSIYGPEAWDDNPWVAAISFEVHRRNINEMERDHD